MFRQEKATLTQEIENLKKQLSVAVPTTAPQECKIEGWCACVREKDKPKVQCMCVECVWMGLYCGGV